MRQTMEQKRAHDAWTKCQGCNSEYQNLAKGLPALIMNSGLMQVMAFLHEKGSKQPQSHCRILGEHLRDWLRRQFPDLITDADFKPFLESLMQADPRDFRMITAEAFAWLKWMRQMAPAARAGD